MKRIRNGLLVATIGAVIVAPPVSWAATCEADAAEVGTTCVDRYEASLWEIPASKVQLIDKVQKGRATLADLQTGGATQVGCASQHKDIRLVAFPIDGNWTTPIYAASLPGVVPSSCITWFQAQQACALSKKRLLTNEEWQRAAAGTPDPGVDDGATLCNIASGGPSNSGSRSACVSNWGVYDMVGNLREHVAEWVDRAAACAAPNMWLAGDRSCMGGDLTNTPGVLWRGGHWADGTLAGVFFVQSDDPLSLIEGGLGFRCGK